MPPRTLNPSELLTLPTRHRYNSLQARPHLPPDPRFPLSSTSIPEKAGHCRVEIVRNYDNSSAGLSEINENSRASSTEEGVKKGMGPPQKQIFRPWKKGQRSANRDKY